MTGSTWLIAVISTLAACPIAVLLWWAASSRHRDVRRARIAAEMTATYEVVHDSPGDYDYADDDVRPARTASAGADVCDDPVWDDPDAWDDPEVWTDPRERTRLVRPVRRFAPAPPAPRSFEDTVILPLRGSMLPRSVGAQAGPAGAPCPARGGRHHLREDYAV